MRLFKRLLPKTLKSKLRLALFAIGFFPFVFILVYLHNLGEKKILDDTLTIYYTQMHMVRKNIASQLETLEKEIGFLASLDMMNDLVVNDVDRRISQLLIQKQKDMAYPVTLLATDPSFKVIATTETGKGESFSEKEALQKMLKKGQHAFKVKDVLYLVTSIKSTRQKGLLLGYLILKYPLSNLDFFSVAQEGVHSLFYFPQSALQIGQMPEKTPLVLHPYHEHYMSQQYLVLTEQLEGVLHEGFIVYMVKKSLALAFLEQFMRFVWILFALGVIVIGLLSWWIGKVILTPISKLSNATEAIIRTQDYTTQVSLSSEGEITELADNFNVMISEINQSFQLLEEENRLRLQRFIQLINIFNRLIRTEREEACIEVAVGELQRLLPEQTFAFETNYPKEENGLNLMLYVKDFEKEVSHFYGVISVSGGQENKMNSEEKRFYSAIATMIMLQLDQIRLIAKTRAVSSAKSSFISHMSHELRTPLHTILSATQYLVSYAGLTLPQQEKVVTIESSADHLLGMINDILDLVQIEAGKVKVEKVNASVAEVERSVKEVLTMLELLAEQKGLTLTFENRVKHLIEVLIDPRFLKQIMINLLSNAVKFTEQGGIEVVMSDCDESVCISVKDSGIGLSKSDLNLLFDEFTQIDHGIVSEQKGSGLGLAISQKQAALFDAELKVESQGVGRGVTATLKLHKV